MMFRRHILEVAVSPWFGNLAAGLIVLNAAVLGLETYTTAMSAYGPMFKTIDRAILWLLMA